MTEYKPKTKEEIEAMSDKRLLSANWWRAMIRHGDKATFDLVCKEVERRQRDEANRK